MSRRLVEDYYAALERVKQYGGTSQELSIRTEFGNLLNTFCKSRNLLMIPELDYKTAKGTTVTPDGTVKDALRLDWGYWESKDEYDDLDKEIQAKLKKGYPTSNIIFEDSKTLVLIQQGRVAGRCDMSDSGQLISLLQRFVEYEREEVRDFRAAIEKFKEDLPTVLTTLRDLIDHQAKTNLEFQEARDKFLKLCQETINPKVTDLDIREMLIQHILTEEIFITVFNESQFHRENTIAQELQRLADTFFSGRVRKETIGLIDHYYLAIKAAASNIYDHHEKQKFLKVLYELFYRTYNPKAADRLGIFFTPNEIVDFMVKSANYLTFKHFGRLLQDPDVEILDPAVGTGTFIADIIEQMPLASLERKYKDEIHCNEVGILPYYIANLNIEFTYKQKTGRYEPYENICFVDTLDNMGFSFKNKQATLFDIGSDNLKRIQRQNKRKISVIIGNPPYNANQLNENENNKNREYPAIDQRIKETYVKASDATKTKVYDMYARFYRWATDRLDKNGIIAFITNRSFIDKLTYDGFRRTIQQEFSAAYIVDTRSDVRANPKIAGTTHNVFGIQTGVAVMFLVKSEEKAGPCLIQYHSLKDETRREEKLEWFAMTKLEDIPFQHLNPDSAGNWIRNKNNDFDDLLYLVDESGKGNSIFKFYSIGVSTNRDEWVFDFDTKNLEAKVKFFIGDYNKQAEKIGKLRLSRRVKLEDIGDVLSYDIKWSRALKGKAFRGDRLKFNPKRILELDYRPFITKRFYADKDLSDFLTKNHYKIFGSALSSPNLVICFSGVGSTRPFSALITTRLWSLDFVEKTQGVPLRTYDRGGVRENISDWALVRFQEHYKDSEITRKAIFAYVYAVLNSPGYHKKYATNLSNRLPRIPFYEDFWKWSGWGDSLIKIHSGFEAARRHPLRAEAVEVAEASRPKSIAEMYSTGKVPLDDGTVLEKVPEGAWRFKIGNRTVIEWVLDQYKEKAPTEEVMRNRFYDYRFEDVKRTVVELIERGVTVSLETVAITDAMEKSG